MPNNGTEFMNVLSIAAQRAGVALPKPNGRHAQSPASANTRELPSSDIDERLQAVAQLPKEERGEQLRALFDALAQLDEFHTTALRPKILEPLGMGKREFEKLLKVARADAAATSETRNEIIEGKYPVLTPALDFYEDIALVMIPLAEQSGTEVTHRPYLITSSREILPAPEGQLATIGHRQVVLREMPTVLGSVSRWSYLHIQEFLKGYTPDAIEVLHRVESLYTKYIDFEKPDTATVLTLWTIGTYFYPLFEAYPYVALQGTKGSGKSKTIGLTEKLAFNARVSSSLSAASLFRIVQATRGTLGIDEGERLAYRNDPVAGDLRLLLNSGYKRGSPALRVEGDGERREVKEFQVYAPKMLASIAGLEEVLGSRCIAVTMLRTMDERGNLAISERAEEWASVRHDLYSLALTAFPKIRAIYENDPSILVLTNRDNELWLPLLAIAKMIEDAGEVGLLEVVQDYATSAAKESEGSSLSDREQALVLALIHLSRDKATVQVTPKQVRDAMGNFLEAAEHLDVKPNWVGHALKRFGFIRQARKTKGSVYQVIASAALDLAMRYGVNIPEIIS